MRICASEPSVCSERKRTVVFLCMCLAIVLLSAPVRPGIVLGESMAPAFHSGQVFLASRVRDPSALEPGDVVLVNVGGQVYLKRVHALGGETIWGLRSPQSGSLLDRMVPRREVPALLEIVGRYRGLGELVEVRVPPRHVFVLGDSRSNSYDSRHFGPVPDKAVRGKVVVTHVFRLWGPSRSGHRVAMAGEREDSSRR